MGASETALHPTVIDDIFSRRLDGITVADVFSESEAAHAVQILERFRERTTGAMFGSMLGMPLAELPRVTDDPSDRSIYLDEAERCTAFYHEAFGFPPEDRLRKVVTPMAGGLIVETPSEAGRHYNAGNVRWFEPGSAGLPAHAGNEFQMHQDGSLGHLRTITTTRDHLSWFVVLQAPEAGGALSVFDRLYDSHRPAQVDWDVNGRDDSDFDDLPAKQIAPRAGTLVLFGGGWRWHRVDKIGGTRQRITYGGFAGRSIDGRSLHTWF